MAVQSTLMHGVRPRKSALEDLHRLDLPGRDPRLPDVYLYVGSHLHPGRRSQTPFQNTYVVFVDPSDEGKKHALAIAETLGIPYGRKETMKKNHPGAYAHLLFGISN